MSRCEAPAPRGGLCARLALVSTVLLGLLAMHAGLAAQAHAPTSSGCPDRSCHDLRPASLHSYEARADHDVHEGAVCSAMFREDPKLVPRHDETYGTPETLWSADALTVGGFSGDPPETPPPRHATDLSVNCVWRL